MKRTTTPASAPARSATRRRWRRRSSAARTGTRDTLRPAGISTYDTGGSSTALDRMLNGNNATDNDLASNSTNTWTNGYVVDAHSNTGLTYDYFFRQHNWSGLDGSNRPMSDIVHSGTEARNNAFFIAPPFGPNRNGAMVYGRTDGGCSGRRHWTSSAHELMHGVTSFSLSNRTGSGFVTHRLHRARTDVVRVQRVDVPVQHDRAYRRPGQSAAVLLQRRAIRARRLPRRRDQRSHLGRLRHERRVLLSACRFGAAEGRLPDGRRHHRLRPEPVAEQSRIDCHPP